MLYFFKNNNARNLIVLLITLTAQQSCHGSRLADFFNQNVKILREMFKNPQAVSAIAASSPWTVDSLTQCIDPKQQQKILELGFGPGNVTRQILLKKAANSSFDGLEILESFFNTTQEELINEGLLDNNSTLHLEGADTWVPDDYKGNPLYDIVISTIPFMRLPKEVVQNIIENVARYLKPGGTFSFITYFLSYPMGHLSLSSQSRLEHREKTALFDALLDTHFTPHSVDFVVRNLPPTYIYHFVKK